MIDILFSFRSALKESKWRGKKCKRKIIIIIDDGRKGFPIISIWITKNDDDVRNINGNE